MCDIAKRYLGLKETQTLINWKHKEAWNIALLTKSLRFLAFWWNFRSKLKLTIIVTGELNVTISKLLNTHIQHPNISVLSAKLAVL